MKTENPNIDKLKTMLKGENALHFEEAKQLNILLSDLRPDEVPQEIHQKLTVIIDMLFLTNNVFAECKCQVDEHYKVISIG